MNVFIGTLLMIIGAVASNPISKALPGRPAKMADTGSALERHFRLAALRAERAKIQHMAHDREIGEVPYQG